MRKIGVLIITVTMMVGIFVPATSYAVSSVDGSSGILDNAVLASISATLDQLANVLSGINLSNDEGGSVLGAATAVSSVKPTILAQPTNLFAIPIPSGQPRVELYFEDHSSNETGFMIERSTTETFAVTSVVATLSNNVKTWNDLNVSFDTLYFYRVKAVLGRKVSPWSNTAPVRIIYPPASNGYFVRPVYFVPKNRIPDPQYEAKLQTVFQLIQQFYAVNLYKQGMGYTPFNLEVNSDGKPKIFLVRGEYDDNYYIPQNETAWQYAHSGDAQIHRELGKVFNFDHELASVDADVQWYDPKNKIEVGPWTGGRWYSSDLPMAKGGVSLVGDAMSYAGTSISNQLSIFCDATIDGLVGPRPIGSNAEQIIGGYAHEMGHAFGAQHSPISVDLMGMGNYMFSRSFVSCINTTDIATITKNFAILFANGALFKKNLNYTDNINPKIEVKIPDFIQSSTSIPIKLTLNDSGGSGLSFMAIYFEGVMFDSIDLRGKGDSYSTTFILNPTKPLSIDYCQANPWNCQIGFYLLDEASNRIEVHYNLNVINGNPFPIASYSFSEGAGTIVTDSSTYKRNGTLSGATWTATGKYGGGLSFDGANDYVKIPGLLGSPQNITLTGWANITGADTYGATIASLGDHVALMADIRKNKVTGAGGFFYDGTLWPQTDSGALYIGTGWHHFAYVFDFIAHAQRVYVDGELKATTSFTKPIVYTGKGSDTFIGKHGNGNAYFDFKGIIDEVRIYNEALIPDQIKKDMDSAPFSLTSPNNGEKWQLGNTHTIQWIPYDPIAGINPASDVSAYLEKFVNGAYVRAGKIVECGKASIHWDGSLDTCGVGGKLAEPGDYYIYVVNNTTGQFDRSDKPVTLVAKGYLNADLKIDGKDDPVTVPADGGTYTASWTSNTEKCSLYNDTLSYKDPDQYKENLPPTGTMSIKLLPNTEWYSKSVGLYCDAKTPVEGSAWDRVDVSSPPAFVTVDSPNGGEKLDRTTKQTILWSSSSALSKVSIALYKNDASYAWIVTDLPVSGALSGSKNSYEWLPSDTVPANGVGNDIFKIYILGYKFDGGTVEDKSDVPFSITAPKPTPTPSIEVVDPVEYKMLGTGSPATITFRWTNTASNFNIYLQQYNPQPDGTKYQGVAVDGPYGSIAYNVTPTVAPGASHQMYDTWQVPTYITGGSRFRIEVCGTFPNATPNYVCGTSADFSIQQPIITVTNPKAGETLPVGKQYTIGWDAAGITSEFTIKLKKGTTLQNIGKAGVTMRTYPWTPPASITPGSYEIYIAGSANGSAKSDSSDLFTISSGSVLGASTEYENIDLQLLANTLINLRSVLVNMLRGLE